MYDGMDTANRLEELLKELLKDARPPRWRLDLWVKRQSDVDLILACARYGWPYWHRIAIRQGVDSELLTTSAKLVGARIPEPGEPHERPKPYLGG